MADVNGICVRKQGEAVALGQFFKESVVMNRSGIKCAVPDFGKLLKAEPAAKPLSQIKIPIVRRDSAFLPIRPAWILFDSRPQLGRSKRATRSKPLHGAGNIDSNEDAADIEDDGAELRGGHGLFNRTVK